MFHYRSQTLILKLSQPKKISNNLHSLSLGSSLITIQGTIFRMWFGFRRKYSSSFMLLYNTFFAHKLTLGNSTHKATARKVKNLQPGIYLNIFS